MHKGSSRIAKVFKAHLEQVNQTLGYFRSQLNRVTQEF